MKYFLVILILGFMSVKTLRAQSDSASIDSLKTIKKVSLKGKQTASTYLATLRDFHVFAGKKSELISLDSMVINTSANTARQIYAKVPGVNIWENDGVGLQLGIGGRGLNPNRVSNFNMRQNGYDISADALGYPESYYTPPAELISQIEIVRGAATLQFGTQFGGMANFILREPNFQKKPGLNIQQTAGSFGFYNGTVMGGAQVKGVNIFAFGQYKRTDGWRKNSGLEAYTQHVAISKSWKNKLEVSAEYTGMQYTAQQPGGLTDMQFEQDARQSFRERNWFRVRWNIMALNVNYKLGKQSKLNARVFGLIGSRDALGNLQPINRADNFAERDLLKDNYNNYGAELRWVKKYNIAQKNVLSVTGFRYYRGSTERNQGLGDSEQGPNFNYLNPDDLERSSFLFPSTNIAAFTEHVIYLSSRLKVVPGLRYEFINTEAAGFYRNQVRDLAGNLIFDEKVDEQRNAERGLLLGGLGMSYSLSGKLEWYGSFSQNYRAVNFNDFRVVNPSFRVDTALQDEQGSTLEMGLRGSLFKGMTIDLSAFRLNYDNRIGAVLQSDTVTFQVYRFRTNVSQSVNQGVEALVQFDLVEIFGKKQSKWSNILFVNGSFVNAEYTDSKEPAFEGNRVEWVPRYILRTGLQTKYKNWSAGILYSYTSSQFSDATNSEFSATAIEGFIPSYQIVDFNLALVVKKFTFRASINNVLNSIYFTRRAAGYPGPGILPSDARAFYLGVSLEI